jgi:hypothetical protein
MIKPMPLAIPPAVNYPSPLIALPTKWENTPPEGPMIVPCEIDWGIMGGSNNNVSINMQNNAVLNFSQIVALSVDNSNCGADVQFVFPDTTETMTVPAYTPKLIIPVFTNQTQFFVYAPLAQSEDITRFSIHNTLPPPIAVPVTAEQNIAGVAGVNISAGTTQIVPANISGTLETMIVFVSMTTSAIINFNIQDGNGAVIATAQLPGPLSGNAYVEPIDLQNVRVRFQNGIKLVITTPTGSTDGSVMVNLYYRTP